MHPYISLLVAQNNGSSIVGPYLMGGMNSRFPTNEEFLRAVPSQQDLEIITADLRRNMPELSSQSMRVASPGSSSGVSRFIHAFNMMYQIPDLKKLVFSLVCDVKVWEAISNNEVVKEIRRASFTAVSTRLLSESEKEKPSKFTTIWRLILDIVMPNLTSFAEVLGSFLKGKSETEGGASAEEASSPPQDSDDFVMIGSLIALCLIVVLMVSLMVHNNL